MTRPAFDEVIHPPNRLQLCAILVGVDSVEFAVARDALGVSDSVLSKQVKILQNAGYVTTTKSPHNSRTHTWLAITDRGREAFAGHIAELRRLSGLTS